MSLVSLRMIEDNFILIGEIEFFRENGTLMDTIFFDNKKITSLE